MTDFNAPNPERKPTAGSSVPSPAHGPVHGNGEPLVIELKGTLPQWCVDSKGGEKFRQMHKEAVELAELCQYMVLCHKYLVFDVSVATQEKLALLKEDDDLRMRLTAYNGNVDQIPLTTSQNNRKRDSLPPEDADLPSAEACNPFDIFESTEALTTILSESILIKDPSELQAALRPAFENMQNGLDSIRFATKLAIFNLELTRREIDELRLNNARLNEEIRRLGNEELEE